MSIFNSGSKKSSLRLGPDRNFSNPEKWFILFFQNGLSKFFGLLLLFLLPLVILLPIFLLILKSADVSVFNQMFQLNNKILREYMQTSLLLMTSTGIMAVIIGVSLAWIFEFFTFPGKKIFSWLILLPFALPPYITAIVWLELFDVSGEGFLFLQHVWAGLTNFFLNIFSNIYSWEKNDTLNLFGSGYSPRQWWLASLVLSFSYYPYVYLLARASMRKNLWNALEIGRSMGYSVSYGFFHIVLPFLKPALWAGFILVSLETLSEYGTMSLFAQKTLAVGMFDLWFNLGQFDFARYLALFALGLVGLLLLWDFFIGKIRVVSARLGGSSHSERKMTLSWRTKLLTLIYLSLLGFLAFFFPFLVLIVWAVQSSLRSGWLAAFGQGDIISAKFWQELSNYGYVLLHSFGLASTTALIALLIGIMISYLERHAQYGKHYIVSHKLLKRFGFNKFRSLLTFKQLSKFQRIVAIISYSMPGSILAIGILVMVQWLYQYLGLDLRASIWILLFAYFCRFNAAALSALSSGYSSISPNLDYAARALGEKSISLDGFNVGNLEKQSLVKKIYPKNWRIFMGRKKTTNKVVKPFIADQFITGVIGRVHLPLLKPAMLAALLLTFIEVVKELPVTLILRPYNFNTLATVVYTYANDERIKLAAAPALLIILVSLISVVLLKRIWARGILD